MNAKRRRDWGRVSPLDRLPDSARAELARLCDTSSKYSEIVEWLAVNHGVKSSRPALCEWNKRRQEKDRADGTIATLMSAGIEIVVAEHQAGEVRITLRALK